MIPYPHINPDLFTIGPLHVRWYGVMYVAGFLVSYFLIKVQEKGRPIGLSPRLLQDLMFYLAIGLIAGARLGYILFYQYMNLTEFVRSARNHRSLAWRHVFSRRLDRHRDCRVVVLQPQGLAVLGCCRQGDCDRADRSWSGKAREFY